MYFCYRLLHKYLKCYDNINFLRSENVQSSALDKSKARSEQNWISLILIAPLSWKINLSIKNFFDIILRQSISHLLQNREKYQILKMYKPAFHLFIFIFVNLEGTVIFLIKRSSSIGFHFCDTSLFIIYPSRFHSNRFHNANQFNFFNVCKCPRAFPDIIKQRCKNEKAR